MKPVAPKQRVVVPVEAEVAPIPEPWVAQIQPGSLVVFRVPPGEVDSLSGTIADRMDEWDEVIGHERWTALVIPLTAEMELLSLEEAEHILKQIREGDRES